MNKSLPSMNNTNPNSRTKHNSLLKRFTATTMKIKQKLEHHTHPNRRRHPVKFITSLILRITARLTSMIVAVYHFLELFWASL